MRLGPSLKTAGIQWLVCERETCSSVLKPLVSCTRLTNILHPHSCRALIKLKTLSGRGEEGLGAGEGGQR